MYLCNALLIHCTYLRTFRLVQLLIDFDDSDDCFLTYMLQCFMQDTLLILNIWTNMLDQMSRGMRFPTMWYEQPSKSQTSLHIRAV